MDKEVGTCLVSTAFVGTVIGRRVPSAAEAAAAAAAMAQAE